MIKRHFTATGIVLNDQNEVLLVHHRKLGVWLPPGGHIEENELPDKAVLREIYEETGVRACLVSGSAYAAIQDKHARVLATPLCVLCEDIGGTGTHFHIDMVYLCRACTQTLSPDVRETRAAGFYAPTALASLPMYDNVRALLHRVQSDEPSIPGS